MEILQLMDVLDNAETKRRTIARIKNGIIFVYPTDTIYGIGCNALDEDAVRKIRDAKRSGKPFSVIAPSFMWIEENFDVKFPEYMERLPGPYTLILEQKRNVIPGIVSKGSKVGIRIPNHPFTNIVQEAGIPFVTTSVNLSGSPPARKISEIDGEIIEFVDVIIDAGELDNQASKVVDLTGEEPVQLR